MASAARISCPAASASAWRSPARWSASRKVLLLDEPLGALDKKLREEMQIELRQLQRTVGITFVFVTHDQEEALDALRPHRGDVARQGAADRRRDAPLRGAELPRGGRVHRHHELLRRHGGEIVGGRAVVDTAHGRFAVEAADAPVGSSVFVAIRPEKLSLSQQQNGANSLPGTVTAVTYLGDRSHFLVAIEGIERPFAVAMQNTGRAPPAAALENAKVFLIWPPEAGLLLTH